MGKKKGKAIKLPKTVKAIAMKRKDWAKKNGLSYSDGSENKERAQEEYVEAFCEGLDRAMEIILDHPDSDTVSKVKENIEVAMSRPNRIKEAAKRYSKHRKDYRYIIYLPNIMISTLQFITDHPDQLSAKETELSKSIDSVVIHDFCDAILKKPKEHYSSYGLSESAALTLASLVPSAKILNNAYWYRALITTLYSMAETDSFEIDDVFEAICSVDKDKILRKRDAERKFWLEFILMKKSVKFQTLNDSQKNLHEHLQSKALEYMDTLSSDELEAMLYKYIKRRRESENSNADSRRIFRFTDHATSNSPYTKIKNVVEKIIKAKPDYEAYLK